MPQLSHYAAVGIAYRLAMPAPARAGAIKRRKTTAKGFSVLVGIPGYEANLDMTPEQFEQFKSTFTKVNN
jgi:hypothetical protein